MSLSYPVVLIKSKEGYAVGWPALPGCWSQGAPEEEALQNIRGAIQDYLSAATDSLKTRTCAKSKWHFCSHIVLSNGTRFVVVRETIPLMPSRWVESSRTRVFTVEEFRKFL